jgi:ribosomal-protein-alanine N-acetyltransferase
VTILRPVVPDDSAEVAHLLRENRDFMAPLEPLRDERFFTSEGQRERIEESSSVSFAIVVEGAIVGGVTISDMLHEPFRSANLGYWVAERLNGRGLATRAVGEAVEIASWNFICTGSRRGRSSITWRHNASSKRTALSESGSPGATCT